MKQIRVNLSLDKEIWEKFAELVPNRQKSRIVNELLKSEIIRKVRQNEETALFHAFAEAAADKERGDVIEDWKILDTEGWN